MIPDLTRSLQSVSSPNEALYTSTKGLIVHILRSLPPQKTKGLSLKAVIDQAISYKADPNISRKGLSAAENLRKLEQEGFLSSGDNYARLAVEVGEVGFLCFSSSFSPRLLTSTSFLSRN